MSVAAVIQESRRRSNIRVTRFRQAGFDESGLAAGGIALTGLESFLGVQSAGERERLQAFRGWVYASIRPKAMTIAGQPVHVGKPSRKRKAGAPEGVEPVPGHRLYDILQRPNRRMLWWHLAYVTVAALDLTGEVFWWLGRDEGRDAIWPIPATWAEWDHRDGPWTHVRISPGGVGQPIRVPADQVAYFHMPDPASPNSVLPPQAAISKAVRTDERIQEAQQRAFQNGIFPSAAIVVGSDEDPDNPDARAMLREEDRLALLDKVRRIYAGTVNAGEPLVLDALIRDIKPLSRTVQEMNFLESGKATKQRITEGFGVNPWIIGSQEAGSYAGSAQAKRHFADFCVNPTISLLSQGMTRWLGRRYAARGEKLYIWIEPYRPDDPELRMKACGVLTKARAITRNELRQELLGLPARDGWDDVLVTANELEQEAGEVRGKGRKASASCVTAWLKSHGRHEKKLAEAMEVYFAEQRDTVWARLQEVLGGSARSKSGIVDEIFRPRDWSERLRETVRPQIEAAASEAASVVLEPQRATRRGSVKGDGLVELPPAVQQAIDLEVATILERPYWDEINETTLQRLSDTIQEGLAAGESLYELGTRIGDAPTVPVSDDALHGVLGSASNAYRARLIARTETTGAMGAGHQAAMEELASSGLVESKEWVTILDDHTRDSHAEANGQTVPVKEDFSVGGNPARYPGDWRLPAAERCNCVLPGQLVSGAFCAGAKAFYVGKAIEIVTRSGRRLAVTPHHRVATEDGLVFAGAIEQGQYVLSYNPEVEIAPSGNGVEGCYQVDDEPSPIEEVFELLRLRHYVVRGAGVKARRTFACDFHGDELSIHGEVHVVGADGVLRDYGVAGAQQEAPHAVLEGRDVGAGKRLLPALCPVAEGGIRSPLASGNRRGSPRRFGDPRRRALPSDGGGILPDARPLNFLGFGLAARLQPGFAEPFVDYIPGHSEPFGDGFHGVAGLVGADDGRDIQRNLPRSPEAGGSQYSIDGGCRAGVAGGQALDRDALPVFLDKVVRVREFNFCGHVYDLQSRTGLIVAENICISNCRCVSIVVS